MKWKSGFFAIGGPPFEADVSYDTDRTDTEIRQEIVEALRWNALVDDSLITVNVQEGVVTLQGTVGSAAERTRAKFDAWVAGVEDVKDNLQVKWWARDERLREKKYQQRPDDEIADAIKAAFIEDPRVLSFDINVTVFNGRATLTGVVDNLMAKRAAERDARNTVGVWGVENQIKVRSTINDDASTTSRITSALARDPYVDRYEIAVTVLDKSATLTGEVDTWSERQNAEQNAREGGAVAVINKLEVDYGPAI